ncbi:MarR family winged helix-turn-helix transcriptional regulator [Humidisolicoccus flavus]|uniref:MarR family winged helix-turn-helix transcriptional regulator n=1 Tax=Humidisolicoccus flavus TaxID=3111414 RepID=UPI00324AB5F6
MSNRETQGLGRDIVFNDPRIIDPHNEILQHSAMNDADVSQIVELMDALRQWREAENRMSARARKRMRVGDTDMRAIRFLMAAHHSGEVVTPARLAEHLGVTRASITKLLDRLEDAGHITRAPHPNDRRALHIRVQDQTRKTAREGVGRMHARRFNIAADYSNEERAVIKKFLLDLAATEADDLALDEPEATEGSRSDRR